MAGRAHRAPVRVTGRRRTPLPDVGGQVHVQAGGSGWYGPSAAQRQQVDSRGGQLRAVGACRNRCGSPARRPRRAVAVEQGPQSGLVRGAGVNAQHHEALRGAQPGRSRYRRAAKTGTQRSGRPADHAHAAPALVDVFEEQDLGPRPSAARPAARPAPSPGGWWPGWPGTLGRRPAQGLGSCAVCGPAVRRCGPSWPRCVLYAARGRRRPCRDAVPGRDWQAPTPPDHQGARRTPDGGHAPVDRRRRRLLVVPGTTLELLPGARTRPPVHPREHVHRRHPGQRQALLGTGTGRSWRCRRRTP